MGDGPDHYGKAVANVAAAVVKAGAKGGKTAAGIAAGTAAGGPWGAILTAAWSLRHTLYKLLVCLCLFVLIMVVMAISLPSIVTDRVWGLDGNQPASDATLSSVYMELAEEVSVVVELGHSLSLEKVEKLIADGGFDHDRSIEALKDLSQETAEYDICYILAAYSASMQQREASREDMIQKLTEAAGGMFPVTSEEREEEAGTQEPSPETDAESVQETEAGTVRYLECTIHPFDQGVAAKAFGLDMDETYGEFPITYGEAVQYMASALRQTLYGTTPDGSSAPLTDPELAAFADTQACSAARKQLVMTGLSLVGKVPYFWGGKSGPGWDEEWNTPKQVTAAGSPTTGTIRPYGLDCSGFTSWVYSTALGADIGAGTSGQFPNSEPIAASELLPGDLGFLPNSKGGYSHVLMFAGYGAEGQRMWVHSSSGKGVVLNTPGYEGNLVLRRPRGVDFDSPVAAERP